MADLTVSHIVLDLSADGWNFCSSLHCRTLLRILSGDGSRAIRTTKGAMAMKAALDEHRCATCNSSVVISPVSSPSYPYLRALRQSLTLFDTVEVCGSSPQGPRMLGPIRVR